MNSRIEKLYRLAGQKDVDAILITSAAGIKYATGYFYNFEIGPSPFQLIPAALLVFQAGYSSLIIADNETDNLVKPGPTIAVRPYSSYTYQKPLDFTNQFLQQFQEVLKPVGRNIRRIGIEARSVPYVVVQSILSAYPDVELIDLTKEILHLRMVKDQDELDAIRAAVHLSDVGQEAVLKYAKPGMSELKLFTLVRGDMEKAAGQRVPVMADLVSGARTFDAGGNPSEKIIEEGDLVLSDITPCLNGYWGDTCNTMVVGNPSADQKNDFNLVQEALSLAIAEIRPGMQVNRIDQLLRKHLSPAGEYNHHSGHGVGIENHEEPRITPYNETLLEPNMVIAIEPGIYRNGYGIRLEHVVAVTQSGCEILSKFNHQFKPV